METVDLLLLNRSNFPGRSVFPYAFVQVRALAMAHGLTFACHDFFADGGKPWRTTLDALIEARRPRLIGVHLRQSDSLFFGDYADARDTSFFPVHDTRELIRHIHETCDAPTIVGGFGFTNQAEQLFKYLGARYAVRGDPTGLFARFEDVVGSGRCEGVPNLAHRTAAGACFNDRVHYGPLDAPEYDDEVMNVMARFYGRGWLAAPDPPTVAVEVARGCPCRCYFCSEPRTKGSAVRRRDLNAVMEDVAFLHSRGVRRFWMVCSELNIGGAGLARELAERVLRFNEAHRDAPVRWRAYVLPRWLDRGDISLLYRSGFAGAWNDFPSLDDDNLARTRVPYRSRHVLEHLRALAEERPRRDGEAPPQIDFFLGNAHVTPAAIAGTIRKFNQAGLTRKNPSATIGLATRLFHPAGWAEAADGPVDVVSFSPEGAARDPTLVSPTFLLPPALLAALGDRRTVVRFLTYAGSTLLSMEHRLTKDWAGFLAGSAPAETIVERIRRRRGGRLHIGGLAPDDAREINGELAALYEEGGAARLARLLTRGDDVASVSALAIAHWLASSPPPGYAAVLTHIGLTGEEHRAPGGGAYETYVTLLRRYGSNPELLSDVSSRLGLSPDAEELWCLRYLLFFHNVELVAAYRPLLLTLDEQ